MKKYFFALLITLFVSAGANAQDDFLWSKNTLSFNWEIGVPLKANYLNSASLAGANLDFRHLSITNSALGLPGIGILLKNTFRRGFLKTPRVPVPFLPMQYHRYM
jgi:hypothetical protein